MMTRTYKLADLRRAAKAVGATVEDDSSGKWRVFQVCTPVGKVWACTGDIHMIPVEWQPGPGGAEWMSNAIEDALERISYGLEDCSDPECDYCHPEGE